MGFLLSKSVVDIYTSLSREIGISINYAEGWWRLGNSYMGVVKFYEKRNLDLPFRPLSLMPFVHYRELIRIAKKEDVEYWEVNFQKSISVISEQIQKDYGNPRFKASLDRQLQMYSVLLQDLEIRRKHIENDHGHVDDLVDLMGEMYSAFMDSIKIYLNNRGGLDSRNVPHIARILDQLCSSKKVNFPFDKYRLAPIVLTHFDSLNKKNLRAFVREETYCVSDNTMRRAKSIVQKM